MFHQILHFMAVTNATLLESVTWLPLPGVSDWVHTLMDQGLPLVQEYHTGHGTG